MGRLVQTQVSLIHLIESCWAESLAWTHFTVELILLKSSVLFRGADSLTLVGHSIPLSSTPHIFIAPYLQAQLSFQTLHAQGVTQAFLSA